MLTRMSLVAAAFLIPQRVCGLMSEVKMDDLPVNSLPNKLVLFGNNRHQTTASEASPAFQASM